MQLIIQNNARLDIKNIYLYSLSQFGELKADEYFFGLNSHIEAIASGFVVSSDCGHVVDQLRRTNFKSHAIYYKLTDDAVIILRVLGQAQEAQRHIH